MSTDSKKRLAGEAAVSYIKDGMILGLGSGSTVYWTMRKLGELIRQGMKVKGIPSSRRTEGWARELGIPLTSFAEAERLDLAIDGADEVDRGFNLIKGGGGSLLREKLVDQASAELIIIVDDSKMVAELGQFPLPVEVVPFGWETTARRIRELGSVPQLRKKDREIFVSDNGNYILDCAFDRIPDPAALHDKLKLLLGVVETGLFVGMADKVIVGADHGSQVIERHSPKGE